MAGRVLRFEIRPDGSLGPAATFAQLVDAQRSDRYDTPYAETGPDGLEIGPNGDLYVVVYGDGRVLRFARNGEYRGAIELPTRYATNITFLPDGSAVTTGSFNNVDRPFPGEVRFHAADAVTRTWCAGHRSVLNGADNAKLQRLLIARASGCRRRGRRGFAEPVAR
jgi:hypothetical protein